jgi:hypothetical protein
MTSDSDDEIFYTVWLKHHEGSVSFGPRDLLFEPDDDDDDDVASLRIPWKDLKTCMLNSAESKNTLLKLVYNDNTKQTFRLATRKDAESLRDDVKSRLKCN